MVHESKIHKDTEYIRQNHQRVENQSGKKWQRIEQLQGGLKIPNLRRLESPHRYFS